jgi:hypothetical protein
MIHFFVKLPALTHLAVDVGAPADEINGFLLLRPALRRVCLIRYESQAAFNTSQAVGRREHDVVKRYLLAASGQEFDPRLREPATYHLRLGLCSIRWHSYIYSYHTFEIC